MCLAHPSVTDQPVDSEYGVEYGQSLNPFEVDAVNIPDTILQLTPIQKKYIHSHYPPLSSSDYLGVDLYLNLHDTLTLMTT